MGELWRLMKLFKPYYGWVLLGIFLSLVTLLSNVTLMAVSGWFIASMAIAGVSGASMNYFTPAAMIRAAAILRTAGRYLERLVTHEATFRLLASLRLWFYRHLEPLVPAALEDMRSGDLLSRIRADIDMLDNLYIRIIVPLAVAVIGMLLTTWVISRYHASLAIVLFMLLLMAGLVLPAVIAKLGKRPGLVVVEQSSLLRTQVVDSVQGMAELTVCGALKDNANQVADSSRQWIAAQKTMGRIAGLAQSGLLLFSNMAVWFVVLLAVPLVTASAIAPAELAMLALFALAAFEAVMPLPEAFRLLGQVQASAKRLFAIIDRPPVITEPVEAADKPASFQIDFEHVTFRYAAHSAPVLRDINLNLGQGKKLAIVGPTGSGKSSLIQLLLRYRAAESGAILLGQRPLEDYRSEQLHDWFAVVPQKVHLFNTTVRNNLLLARPGASRQELDRACHLAQLDDFIAQQPRGYDTWVGETGIKLSGGQARRIAIARALLRDFECLILDEPGEGLDSRTERDLVSGLVQAIGDRSLILITHSQAGLNQVDEIIVLENGVCVARGDYPSLKASAARIANITID
jgi:ATP-binding cassette subfamily C protein CydC